MNMKICRSCIYVNSQNKTFCNNCKYKTNAQAPTITTIPTMPTRPPQGENRPPRAPQQPQSTQRPQNGNAQGSSSCGANFFERNGWESSWSSFVKTAGGRKNGIILTNTKACPSDKKKDFMQALERYVAHAEKNGTSYCILDMATQKVKPMSSSDANITLDFVISLLTKVYDVAQINYLMIVGDRESVPSAKWENPIYDNGGDNDRYVDSDVPYVFLCAKSLFDGTHTDKNIRVGRVPSSAANGFSEAKLYFENTIKYHDPKRNIKAVSLSAEEWSYVSSKNFESVHPDLNNCPPSSFVKGASEKLIEHDPLYNLYCFNIHGMAIQNVWLSGDSTIAMNPTSLPGNPKSAYVMATEACYGAKPVIRNGKEQSILMTALQNRCLGFLGSTQIAYGTTDIALIFGLEPMCADIMVGHFVECVGKGYALGDAYLSAWSKLSGHSNALENIKTLCSFALYGDPTAELTVATGKKVVNNNKKIVIPVAENVTKMPMTKVASKSALSIQSFVREHFADFANSQPTFYILNNGNKSSNKVANGSSPEMKATYVNKKSKYQQILHLYFNADGKVTSICVSK